MARRLLMGLHVGQHGCAVDGGAGSSLVARLLSTAPAVVITLVVAMAAVGGAFIGRQGAPWEPTWGTVADQATSQPSVGADAQNDPGRGDHVNDDGYLEGVARAMGYDSVQQMARASRQEAPSNLVHR
jgi:hypothetical protein